MPRNLTDDQRAALETLARAFAAMRRTQDAFQLALRAAHDSGASWDKIAAVIGVTKQTARTNYLRMVRDHRTGENEDGTGTD